MTRIDVCRLAVFGAALWAMHWTALALGQDLQDDVERLVAASRQALRAPAVFAAIAFDERQPLVVADGLRKFGEAQPVTTDDLIHIGSCTKAFTAVLAARLVEQGQLDWNDTLGERLPDLTQHLHPDWSQATLVQLLSHRAGVPANAHNWWLRRGETIDEIRDQIAIHNLQAAPGAPLGSAFEYSNLSYLLAGQMIARANDSTWEEAMRQHVFEPLGITAAGFGPPGTREGVEQPWGHLPIQDGGWLPLHRDNAPALGAAGIIHLSLRDWCQFVSVFIGGGPPDFLNADSLARLSTPVGNDYALGWNVAPRRWAEGVTLSHSGSNTMWYCIVWAAPRTGRAYLVATNCMRDDVPGALDQLVGQIIAAERHDAKKPRNPLRNSY